MSDTKCRTGDWLVTDQWLEWTWIVTELHRLVVCLSLGHEDLLALSRKDGRLVSGSAEEREWLLLWLCV